MVALSTSLVETLGDLVVEVREGYEAGAWAIPEAISQHEAFMDTNGPRSTLTRAIISREFRTAAGRLGLTARSGLGGAVELYELNGSEFAVIRLRSAEEVAGELRVIANSGSTWGGLTDDGFWREVPYVFGWIAGPGDALEFFVAEVIGQTDSAVAQLEFGWTHRFQPSVPQTGASFAPDDGDLLDGWDLPEHGVIGNEA